MEALFGLSSKPFKGYFGALLGYSVVVNLLVLVPSVHMLQVYDRVLSSNSASTLFYLTLISAFLLIFYGLADSVRSRIAIRLAASYSISAAPNLFGRFATDRGSPSETAQAVRDFSAARGFLAGKSFTGLFDLPFIPLYVAVMFVVHWSLGVFTLVSIALLITVALVNVAASEKDREASRKADTDVAGYSQSVLGMPEELRAFGTAGHFEAIWNTKLAKALISAEEAGETSARYQALSKSLRQILQVMVMALGGYLAISGNMSAGLIFMASMVSGKALGPIDQLTGGWEQISKGFAALKALEPYTSQPAAPAEKVRIPQLNGHLAARTISCVPDSKKPDRIVLDAVSLDVRPGEVVVITGATGAGKTALMRILSHAIDPTGGRLTLDGLDAAAWPADQWAKLVGYVPQELAFFPGTVAANIARFDPKASGEAVVHSARLAGAHETIMRLPEGYGTRIGSGGVVLSSGQKQQIALARAFFTSPKVLVLDEPNSHLDADGEAAMLRALVAARDGGAGVIITAHRTSVLKIATRVLILEGGKLRPLEIAAPGSAPTAVQAPVPARPKIPAGEPSASPDRVHAMEARP